MKKKNIFLAIIIAVLVIFFLAIITMFYTIGESEQAVITQFGKVIGEPIKDAGLHMKLPWQNVNLFEKRILEWDGIPTQIPDLEKKNIIIDIFARWKITDARQFLVSLQGIEAEAQTRLDDIIESAARDVVTNHPIIELVRNTNRKMEMVDVGSLDREDASDEYLIEKGRVKLQQMILENARNSMPEIGIELVDIRIKRINYVESVRQEIYRRMISERNRIAQRYRAEGAGMAKEIDGKRRRLLNEIISKAEKEVLEIIGKADGKAAKIYADAYNVDPDFYSFWKTMETYLTTIDKSSWIILSTTGDFSKYLKSMGR